MTTNSPPVLESTVRDEDRALAAAAIISILIASTLTPWGGGQLRSIQAVAVAAPGAFAATLAWTRGERRILAPTAALVLAVALSGVLALLRGTSWTFSLGAATFILGGWLPWPRWRAPSAARIVLWALALAPLVVMALAAVLDWTDWPADLLEGGRIASTPGNAALAAWTMLWSVMAAEVLARRGERGASVVQAISLLLLGATGTRAAGAVALTVLAVLLWHNRAQGLGPLLRRHGTWGLFALTWLPRVLGRLQGAGGDDAVAGVALSRRSEVWSAYWEEGRHLIWTGGGLGRTQAIAAQRSELRGLSPHNEYLWVALSVGVLGLVLVAAAWFVAIRARTSWVLPTHPELLAPAVALPLVGLVDDLLLALTFVQPYLILLAAGARRCESDPEASAARQPDLEHRVGGGRPDQTR